MVEVDAIDVTAGEEFSIRLPAPATSGFVWDTSSLPEGIELLESAFEPPTLLEMPGKPTIQMLRFRATRAGEHILTLKLKRSWEQQAARSHSVIVRVHRSP